MGIRWSDWKRYLLADAEQRDPALRDESTTVAVVGLRAVVFIAVAGIGFMLTVTTISSKLGDGLEDFVVGEFVAGWEGHDYLSVGTRRSSSSNQLRTTWICAACGLSPDSLSSRNRRPSGKDRKIHTCPAAVRPKFPH